MNVIDNELTIKILLNAVFIILYWQGRIEVLVESCKYHGLLDALVLFLYGHASCWKLNNSTTKPLILLKY